MNDKFQIAQLEDRIINTVDNYVKQNVPRPFGLLLSGGFDSGLLAALTQPDFVYTVRFKNGSTYDESRFADSIIRHLGLTSRVHILEIEKEDFAESAVPAIKAMGEPVSHFSLVPFYMLMEFASEHMKSKGLAPHILSGEGPDEYLGGYARQIIFDELKKLFSIPELRGYHPMIYKALQEPVELNDVLSVDDALACKYAEMMGYDALEATEHAGDYQLQGQIGKMDMSLGVIEKMEQKLAKNFGVTLHYPYINEEFAEYCYALPDDLKIRNGVTKYAFREICRKYLPAFVMDRAKMGGPVAPVNEWLFGKSGFGKEQWTQYQLGVLTEK